jgi:hypothetical protein
MPNLYVALTHYPVVNKSGDIIASAVTNLDLHDISRAVKTFGVKSFYVITPLKDQQGLAKRIVAHWTNGHGADYNPARRSALETIKVIDSVADVAQDIKRLESRYPKTVATSARGYPASIGYNDLRNELKNGMPYLLVFGTAWGLAEPFISEADYVLKPIAGISDYNHLSVRSAAAIILDRLVGRHRRF